MSSSDESSDFSEASDSGSESNSSGGSSSRGSSSGSGSGSGSDESSVAERAVGGGGRGDEEEQLTGATKYNGKPNFAFSPHLVSRGLGFPKSNIPAPCQPLLLRNCAITLTYLASGLVEGLLSPILTTYIRDIGGSAKQQQGLEKLFYISLIFRIFFGVYTDNIQFGGQRRKPALFLGWFISMVAIILLMTASNANYVQGQDPPDNSPSIALLCNTLFFFGLGMTLASTVADGMVAEKYHLEKPDSQGNFLTTCLSFRYFGLAVAVTFSTTIYANVGSIAIFVLLGLIPGSLMFFVMYLEEDVNIKDLKGFKQNIANLWDMLQTRAVWQSISFIFLYNVVQISNPAWGDFLSISLDFSQTQVDVVTIVSLILLYLGIICFKYGFLHWSWKIMFVITTILSFLGALMQLLLVNDIDFGVSQFFYAYSNAGFLSLIDGIQLVPMNLMIVAICPRGGEATAFGLYATIGNFAVFISASLGSLLVEAYGVTEDLLSQGQLEYGSAMGKLTTTAALFSASGLIWVMTLMPHSKMQVDYWKKSKWNLGGWIVLAITCTGFLYIFLMVIISLAI